MSNNNSKNILSIYTHAYIIYHQFRF